MKMMGFFRRNSSRKAVSSDFSVFFREASAGKKKEVFMDVARKASADQRQVIETARKASLTTA